MTLRIEAESNGRPSGSSLGTLTTAGGTGTVSFSTSDGIDLAPGTTYFVVLGSSSGSGTYALTTSDNEDSGAAAGWTIGNGSLFGGTWSGTSNTSLQMAVHGYARSTPTLVTNAAQTGGGNATLNRDHGQAFTTGSHPNGYTLTGVDLFLGLTSGTAPTYTVKVHPESTSTAERPDTGTTTGTLTQHGSLPGSAAAVRFAAPAGGIALDADTTYFVVLDVTAGPNENGIAQRIDANTEDSGAGGRLEHRELPPVAGFDRHDMDQGDRERPRPEDRRARRGDAHRRALGGHDHGRFRGDRGHGRGVHRDGEPGAGRRPDGQPDGVRVVGQRLRGERRRGLEDGDDHRRQHERHLLGGDGGRHDGRAERHRDGGPGGGRLHAGRDDIRRRGGERRRRPAARDHDRGFSRG